MAKKQNAAADVPEKFDDALEELRGLMELLESDDITVDTLTQAIRRAAVLLNCLLYTSPSPRDATLSRMPSSA